ncbi:MAG: hypothetical protein ACOYN0_15455 [Phycisphaerales bacterium]
MEPVEPSPNGANGGRGRKPPKDGRGPDGRFVPGNPGGPGNPLGRKVGGLRSAMMAAVAASDIRDVIRKLVSAAKAGEPWAVRELLDRVFGKPEAFDLVERLEELEEANTKETPASP